MPTRWTPSLDDFVDMASFVLGTSPESIRRLPRLPLAESALSAPFAAFGGTEAYPALLDQAAVLVRHSRRTIRCPTATSVSRSSSRPAFSTPTG